jgi:hypothetical protein
MKQKLLFVIDDETKQKLQAIAGGKRMMSETIRQLINAEWERTANPDIVSIPIVGTISEKGIKYNGTHN